MKCFHVSVMQHHMWPERPRCNPPTPPPADLTRSSHFNSAAHLAPLSTEGRDRQSPIVVSWPADHLESSFIICLSHFYTLLNVQRASAAATMLSTAQRHQIQSKTNLKYSQCTDLTACNRPIKSEQVKVE